MEQARKSDIRIGWPGAKKWGCFGGRGTEEADADRFGSQPYVRY